MTGTDPKAEDRDVDPEEFLRAMLRISPEDAARVREDAAKQPAKDERRETPEDQSPGIS